MATDFSWWGSLAQGLAAVWGWQAMGLIALGVLIGSVFGVLPGVGPVTAIALLLPATLGLPSLPALLVIAGVYYGAQYGGSLPAIVFDRPGEASSVMTSRDGHPMALQGRTGVALSVAVISSCVAGCLAIGLVVLLAPGVVSLGVQFGPAERFLLLVVGLVGATVLASGSFLKALAMTVLGLLLGLMGWDANTGVARFVPEALEPWMGRRHGLTEGVGFIALALGFFVVAPIAAELAGLSLLAPDTPPEPTAAAPKATGFDTRASREELRDALPALLRGTGLGANINIPLPPGSGHEAYMHAMERIVIPALERFEPELIIVACGYDANAVDPLARMLLHSDSFREMTQCLRDAAERLCRGRLVLVHEGGYSEAYVPFCGLATLEELSGVRTAVDDPMLALVELQFRSDNGSALKMQVRHH